MGGFPLAGKSPNEPPIKIDIVITASKEFRVGEHRVLSVTQECECRTVLVLEIVLGNCWYLVPVGILTGDLLEIDPALPTVVPAESSCYLKALMHYESPVALKGSGILQLVYMMGEHEDRKVPQCPLVSYPLVLMYSGGIAIITGVVLRWQDGADGFPHILPSTAS